MRDFNEGLLKKMFSSSELALDKLIELAGKLAINFWVESTCFESYID